MGENTKIEWCHHTFNPWIGCAKVSDGCKFCYAETLMDHRYGKVEWGPRGERKRTSKSYWKQPFQWNRAAQAQGTRQRVFCASLADVFEDRRGQDPLTLWRAQLWYLIEQTPNLDWLLLTKRPENILAMTPQHWRPLPDNIWIGTSVEDQANADKRIPHLINVRARVRFLSCEPLLGPIDFRKVPGFNRIGLDLRGWWVIVGGESGPKARPFRVEWGINLMAQCANAGVAFFWKQMGDHVIDRHGERIRLAHKGGDWSQWPEELRVREFPASEAAHAAA